MAARHDARGWWLEEAGDVEPCPALPGDCRADVAVLGGGYTGMWAAWHVKRLEPEARVVLLEEGLCGDGPSGRNGGFVEPLWFSLPNLRERFGDEPALAVARAAARSVEQIGEFCEEQGVDAWFHRGGYLQVSTAPAWDGQWGKALRACEELGEPGAMIELTPEEVRRRCDSPVFRGGALYPAGATVQPARLAHGLRDRLLAAGVRIHERTSVVRVRKADGEVRIDTTRGAVRAGAAVMAMGGRLLRHGLGRRLTLTSSHIVLTEPVPDLLEEIGWTGGECITDSRAMVHYFRTTRDGRIVFGWGAGRVGFGAATRGRAEVDPPIVAQVEEHLCRFFPGLEGRRVERAWGGPIDVSPSHLPVVGTLHGRIHYGFGYTGNGVGPSQMVGRSLASLALERRDEASRLAIVEPPRIRVPPEPFRYIGGTLIRRALVAKEAAMEEGRRPNPVASAVAGVPEKIGIHVGR